MYTYLDGTPVRPPTKSSIRREDETLLIVRGADPAPAFVLRIGGEMIELDGTPEERATLYEQIHALPFESLLDLQQPRLSTNKGAPIAPRANGITRWVGRWANEFVLLLLKAIAKSCSPPDPADWRWRGGELPRRRWDPAFTALLPTGMDQMWHRLHTRHVLFQRRRYFTWGAPRELLSIAIPADVPGIVRDIVMAGGRRMNGETHRGAKKMLRKRWTATLPGGIPKFQRPHVSSLSESTQNTRWLTHHLLNGMAPARLRKTDATDAYVTVYDFTGLPFGDALGRAADHYKLPNTRVWFRTVQGEARVERIDLQYRDASHPGFATGTAASYGDWIQVDVATAPSWRVSAARRIAVGVALIAGQLDGHVSMGHLAMEAFAVCLERAGLDDEHPVARVLRPRFHELIAVNRNADDAIWGPYGLFSVCTALSSEGLLKRVKERVAARDWKGFRPRATAIADNHYAPRVLSRYFDRVVLPYVRDALDVQPDGSMDWFQPGTTEYDQMLAFFEEIRTLPISWRPWDGDANIPWVDDSELSAAAPGAPAFSLGSTADDVVQLVAFLLYNLTLGHTWPNARQWEAAGDERVGTPSLRLAIDEGPQSSAWQQAADPDPEDALFMTLVVHALTFLDVDDFEKELAETAVESEQSLPRMDPLGDRPDRLDVMLAGRFDDERAALVALASGTFPDPSIGDLGEQLSRPNR